MITVIYAHKAGQGVTATLATLTPPTDTAPCSSTPAPTSPPHSASTNPTGPDSATTSPTRPSPSPTSPPPSPRTSTSSPTVTTPPSGTTLSNHGHRLPPLRKKSQTHWEVGDAHLRRGVLPYRSLEVRDRVRFIACAVRCRQRGAAPLIGGAPFRWFGVASRLHAANQWSCPLFLSPRSAPPRPAPVLRSVRSSTISNEVHGDRNRTQALPATTPTRRRRPGCGVAAASTHTNSPVRSTPDCSGPCSRVVTH